VRSGRTDIPVKTGETVLLRQTKKGKNM